MWMKQLEEYFEFPSDNRIPPRVNANIHKMIVQPAMLYMLQTVPMACYQMKKMEGTEMTMCR